MTSNAIEAELIGSTVCRARGITVRGSAPVLALCRALIGAGYDPSRHLHVYRGQTLALKVRSIGEGAKLTVSDMHGRPRFRRMVLQDWMQEARPTPLGGGHYLDTRDNHHATGNAAAYESEAQEK